mgnify:CR=1 FL=1|tara:strand:+ start:2149 stop:2304 length:156 start_codon:yes stop_codon:yes gene_type:complete
MKAKYNKWVKVLMFLNDFGLSKEKVMSLGKISRATFYRYKNIKNFRKLHKN